MATKYTIRIHVIPLSDTNGARANTVTAAKFATAVAGMNAIFEPADIRFAFDPEKDWHPRNDTSLNSLNNGGSSWWTGGNAVAKQHRGRMVVFLRWGKDQDKRANNWFAYPPNTGQQQPAQAKLPTANVDFVACSNDGNGFENRGALLAHEVGHYLGLFHTHPGWGNTDVATIEDLVAKGGVAALNGDLLSDTAPDPGAFYYREEVDASACGGPASFTIKGKTVTPPRSNVMSYFRCAPVTITAQQIQVVRSTLQHAHRKHLIETSAGIRYAGVFLPGKDNHALWVGDDWKGFTDKWKELAKQGLRLHDLESYVTGGRRRFTGVFRAGTGGHGLWVHDSWKGFTDNWKQVSKDGLRLHDFETWTEGSTRKFAGVYLAGSGGHALWYNDDWHGFHEKWLELSKAGLRLVDIEVFGSLVS